MVRRRSLDRHFLCCLIAAGAFSPCAIAALAEAGQTPAVRHREAALALLRDGDAQLSLAEIRAALAIDPNDAASHDVLGVILGESGQVGLSVSEFREAIRLDPDSVDAHFHLGLALERTDNPRDAIFEYERALLLKPELLEARYGLSSVCAKIDDLSGAIGLLRDIVDAMPQLAEARHNLGLNLWNRYKRSTGKRPQKDLEDARDELQAAVELAPGGAAFHAALGQLLAETQDLDAAVE
jgi:tetratricopeptide (TPR) repeat protein